MSLPPRGGEQNLKLAFADAIRGGRHTGILDHGAATLTVHHRTASGVSYHAFRGTASTGRRLLIDCGRLMDIFPTLEGSPAQSAVPALPQCLFLPKPMRAIIETQTVGSQVDRKRPCRA